MRSKAILIAFLSILTLPLTAIGDPPAYTNAAIQGQYKCFLTAYSLPAKANQPFAATATGDITTVADGNGKLSSGTWDHTIDAPGLHIGCKLALSSGTYSINSDGSGSESLSWRLVKSDSSPECATYFPDTAPAGNAEIVVTDPSGKIFYTSSLNPVAILAVACRSDREIFCAGSRQRHRLHPK